MVDDPTLRAQIETEVLATIPEPLTGMIDRMVADLRDRGVTPGIAVGEHAPGFEAPDVRGELVRLDDRLATGPVVLTFYRGAWCPICNLELRALQAILPQLGAAGASLVAISPQGPDASLPLVESLDLGFDVLSDLDQSIIGAYRLRFELPDELKAVYEQVEMPLTSVNADTSWYLPVAATFVIDADGVVRARHVDSDHRTRMEPRDVLAAVAEVTR